MVGWFMIASAVANAVGAAVGGRAARPRRPHGPARLAVGLPRHRRPRDRAGRRGARRPARPARSRPVGSTRTARLGCHGVLEAERAGAHVVDHANPFRGRSSTARVLLLALLLRRLPARGLWAELLAADRGQGLRGLQHRQRPAQRHPVGLRRAWRCGGCRATPRATSEQTWHIVVPALLGAGCLVAERARARQRRSSSRCCAWPPPASSPASRCSGRCRRPSSRARPPRPGIAAINSVGNLGGFVAQNVVPWIKDATGSDLAPMLFLAACLALGAAMVFVVQAALRRGRETQVQAATTGGARAGAA